MAFFRNHFLIAMPDLDDPCFSQSVVYLYEHDQSGAMGFVINKPTDITVGDVFERIDVKATSECKHTKTPLLMGGPNNREQVFMIILDDQIELSTTKETLELMAGGSEDIVAFLGYSGWSPGQLEQEIMENSWLIAPANNELLFRTPFKKRYSGALALIGVDLENLSGQTGHA
jgi:putative transcriptional regulator